MNTMLVMSFEIVTCCLLMKKNNKNLPEIIMMIKIVHLPDNLFKLLILIHYTCQGICII